MADEPEFMQLERPALNMNTYNEDECFMEFQDIRLFKDTVVRFSEAQNSLEGRVQGKGEGGGKWGRGFTGNPSSYTPISAYTRIAFFL